MVTAASLALPFVVVVALWFVSTGVVAMISHRLRASFGRALLSACVCAFTGLGLVVLSSQSTSALASYASFVGGLLVWSWHEISFLTGAVAGTHREPCPPDAKGWQRFSMATMALIHHEIALAMTAGLLLSLAAVTANPTGAYAFALLLVFRLASKLNIYCGVPSLSDDLLPSHLTYLKSYFGPKRLHGMLPVTLVLIVALASYLALVALSAPTTGTAVSVSLLCCLTLLAALEHLFLALPIRDSALWDWALRARNKIDMREGMNR